MPRMFSDWIMYLTNYEAQIGYQHNIMYAKKELEPKCDGFWHVIAYVDDVHTGEGRAKGQKEAQGKAAAQVLRYLSEDTYYGLLQKHSNLAPLPM